MSLADDVRQLELLREQGALSEEEFEARIADLLRSVTAASEPTILTGHAGPDDEQMQGGPPPAHLGAYELMELLGQGGMGSVYLAKHLLKPGLFAVKVPRRDFLRRPGFGHHFKKEAGVGLKLDHPGIVRVLDLVIDGEWAAIVMQFVAGPNLESVLRNNGGPLTHHRVVDLMCQVLDAMDYAHDAGVLHRDLKPKNLLLHPSGKVQVTDFGVAGLIGMEENQMGNVLGTAPYMAPELYTGSARIDRRTDIYALGMTLYKLLVGKLPFSRHMNPYMVLRAKEEGRVPLPAELGVDVPTPLVEVLFRALRPNPQDRFASCAAFRDTLREAERFQTTMPSRIVPAQPIAHKQDSAPPSEPDARMSSGTLMMLLVVCALLAAVIALALDSDEFQDLMASSETSRQVGLREGLEPHAGLPPHSIPGGEGLEGRAHEHLQPEDSRPAEPTEAITTTPTEETTPARKSRADRAKERRQKRREERLQREQRRAKREARRSEVATGTPAQEETPAEAAEAAPAEEPAPEPSTATPAATSAATVPEATTPSAPAGPAMGFLYLTARPTCEVWIDGKSYGDTQRTGRGLILHEGTYKVRFVCLDEENCSGFDKRAGVKTLRVYADRATRYEADFHRLNK